MKGRRSVAVLWVLLAHALIVYSLLHLRSAPERARTEDDFDSKPITLFPLDEEAVAPAEPPRAPPLESPPVRAPSAPSGPAPSPGESAAITPPVPVDWPLEGKKSATRVLQREAEAERIAKLFAGPGGTWASLTKRERSKLAKFKWKPGVDGLEYDEHGNAIYHLPNGCNIVNFMFFGCPIGKQPVEGHLFDHMQEYFDEQRLPQTNEGNGTEPEALRPAN